jgi:ribosomal protein L37AE/L43A
MHWALSRKKKNNEGNIEYWYCSGCGKYYKDAAATQEIKQADTVIPKQTDNPPTGDHSNLLY